MSDIDLKDIQQQHDQMLTNDREIRTRLKRIEFMLQQMVPNIAVFVRISPTQEVGIQRGQFTFRNHVLSMRKSDQWDREDRITFSKHLPDLVVKIRNEVGASLAAQAIALQTTRNVEIDLATSPIVEP